MWVPSPASFPRKSGRDNRKVNLGSLGPSFWSWSLCSFIIWKLLSLGPNRNLIEKVLYQILLILICHLYFQGIECICGSFWCSRTSPGTARRKEGNPEVSHIPGKQLKMGRTSVHQNQLLQPVFPSCQAAAETWISTVEAILWGKVFSTKLISYSAASTGLGVSVTLETQNTTPASL